MGKKRRGDIDDDLDFDEELSTFEKYVQSTFAEFAGTFFYTFIACLAVTSQDVVSIAFAEGLAIALLCSAFLNISGGLFNPALTFAVALSGGINPFVAVLYFIGQVSGGLAGAAFVKAVLSQDSYYDIQGGANMFRGNVPFDKYDSDHHLEVTTGTAVIIECMLSIFIFMAYLQSNLDPKSKQVTGPLAYGFAVVVAILTAYHTSGASFNPARSFGPACVAYFWEDHYIYWAGPFIGGLLAGVFYRLVLGDSSKRLIMKN